MLRSTRTLEAGLRPGASLAGAAALSLVVACLQNLQACAVGLCLSLALLVLAKPRLRRLFSRFLAVNFFVLFLWAFVPWTMPGQEIWRLGYFAISRAGVDLCLLVTIKANAILAILLALVAPLSVSGLAAGLSELRCPPRLALLILLMERNVYILKREWRKLEEAAKLRAFSPKSSLQAYRALAAMLALLLARAHDRGERLREALALAGYNGKMPFARKKRAGLAEIGFAFFILCSCVSLVYLNYD